MQTWAPVVALVVSVGGAAFAILRGMFRIGQQLEERMGSFLTKDEHSHICQRNQEVIIERIDTLATTMQEQQVESRAERAHLRETVQKLAVEVAVLTDRSDPR